MHNKKNIVILSPFLILLINYIVAIVSGQIIGKWAFVPIILIEWCLFIFFILRFGGLTSVKEWLKKPGGKFGWTILALAIGLLPIPLFLKNGGLLTSWNIWLPWILLALINPWIEEFYWRGLISDNTNKWPAWLGILFSSILFAVNHAVFGINSELLSGFETIITTFILGLIWAIVYRKTKSLRWIIVGHFLVDFLSVSVPSFLDMYKKGW